MNHNLSDIDLLIRIRQGDRFSYTTLFNRYKAYAHVVVKETITTNKTCVTADDLLAICYEVFDECVKNYASNVDGFYPYWKASVVHALNKELINSYRYYSLHDSCYDDDDFYGRPNAEKIGVIDNDVQENLLKYELNKAIENNVFNFTKMEKKVFLIKYRNAKTTKETADLLNISISSVNRHYKSALIKFTSFIKEHYIK